MFIYFLCVFQELYSSSEQIIKVETPLDLAVEPSQLDIMKSKEKYDRSGRYQNNTISVIITEKFHLASHIRNAQGKFRWTSPITSVRAKFGVISYVQRNELGTYIGAVRGKFSTYSLSIVIQLMQGLLKNGLDTYIGDVQGTFSTYSPNVGIQLLQVYFYKTSEHIYSMKYMVTISSQNLFTHQRTNSTIAPTSDAPTSDAYSSDLESPQDINSFEKCTVKSPDTQTLPRNASQVNLEKNISNPLPLPPSWDAHVLNDQFDDNELQYFPKLFMCLPTTKKGCKDASGNTLLHLVIEAQNMDIDTIKSLLKSVPDLAEIRNEDNLTPLDLAFEKKLWLPARALAEHHIKTGASCVLLQEYFFKAMREQGGVDFLPHLLDLRKLYFPDLDLNFSLNARGRTPWWYLANSNDISVMCRALQTFKDHSIDFFPLLTHTERQTRLVEEAADKNRLLFRAIHKVAGWHHSSAADQGTAVEYDSSSTGVLSRATSCSSISTVSFFDQSENQVSIQSEIIQHRSAMSYKASMTNQCHLVLSTSDSSSEEWKQTDSNLKARKRKSKKTDTSGSVGSLKLFHHFM